MSSWIWRAVATRKSAGVNHAARSDFSTGRRRQQRLPRPLLARPSRHQNRILIGELWGFEIKSEGDSLVRLGVQQASSGTSEHSVTSTLTSPYFCFSFIRSIPGRLRFCPESETASIDFHCSSDKGVRDVLSYREAPRIRRGAPTVSLPERRYYSSSWLFASV